MVAVCACAVEPAGVAVIVMVDVPFGAMLTLLPPHPLNAPSDNNTPPNASSRLGIL